ncbi:flavin reductase family protein [Paraburkholderia sp.]|uniref:flavin reductase family protein n=1 Tax=Paraburkholderia sp. TaxID=1926495 RepID=UPI003D6F02B4
MTDIAPVITPEASHQVPLRQALSAFSTGVTVVSTVSGTGAPVGLTANSFNVLSLEPPLVLWSLRTNSSCVEAFQSASHFTINILSEQQLELSRRFARPGDDRFDGVTWRFGPGAVPRIQGCAAIFECRTVSRQIYGDHVLIIGRVEDYRYQAKRPLIFHHGRYHALGEPL